MSKLFELTLFGRWLESKFESDSESDSNLDSDSDLKSDSQQQPTRAS